MIVLVDYSWLRYRSMFAFSKLEVKKKGVVYKTGVIFGVYQSLKIIFDRNPDATIYMCLDGVPTKQIAANPSYKADREFESTQEYLDIGYASVAEAFSIIPQVKLAYSPTMEADETIAFLAETLDKGSEEPTVIFSTDFDLRQLVDDSNKVYCAKTEAGDLGFALENEDYVFNYGCSSAKGVKPESIALFKAITGDSSDNIHGVPRFPKELAKSLVNECPELDKLHEFLKGAKLSRHTQAYNRLLMEWPRISTNYMMTNIDPSDVPLVWDKSPDVNGRGHMDWFEYYDAISVAAGVQRLIESQK